MIIKAEHLAVFAILILLAVFLWQRVSANRKNSW